MSLLKHNETDVLEKEKITPRVDENNDCCGPDCCTPENSTNTSTNSNAAVASVDATEIGNDKIRQAVRQNYGEIAVSERSTCCTTDGCSTDLAGKDASEIAKALGYSEAEIANVPLGSNMGLGCGNPTAIASLKPGQVVLDLGSGGGFDCFLAAREVGETGEVIGVDMTPEMVSKARKNAAGADYTNVSFRLGEIENVPVADNYVDVIISNCVINLSPEKAQVFQEAYRVLKPGGRLAISDVVATAELPEHIRKDLALYTGCISGASLISDLEKMLTAAGFSEIRITPKDESRAFITEWIPGKNIEDYIVSAIIEAVK